MFITVTSPDWQFDKRRPGSWSSKGKRSVGKLHRSDERVGSGSDSGETERFPLKEPKPGVSSMFSGFQLQCCGINNFTDWGGNSPPSCCLQSCSTNPPFQKVNVLVKVGSFFVAALQRRFVCRAVWLH